MTNTILQVIKIDPELLGEVKDSFNNLPESDHADGKYRLRKYSRVSVIDADEKSMCKNPPWDRPPPRLTDLGVNQFSQSNKYNQHQGGVVRDFNGIDGEVLGGVAIPTLAESFRDACGLGSKFVMDIHQMRIKCLGGATQISPEGWHQDGYDVVSMIGVDRNNIIGGEILLSTSKTERPFLQAQIDTGTMVVIDDSYLWHNGRSIQPKDGNKLAWMDVMVFTFKK